MLKRTLFFQSPGFLKLENKQLSQITFAQAKVLCHSLKLWPIMLMIWAF